MTKERNGALLARPLSARSVIASFLLGMHPPSMAAADLVRACGRLGIAEGTARVALSRMVERGELTARDGRYELAGRVRTRQEAQDWSLTPRLLPWDGRWILAMVEDGRRRTPADRAALRDAMRRARFAEVRAGCWTRPDNLPDEASPPDARAAIARQCATWTGEPDEDPRALAARLFDPVGWAARAVALQGHLEAATAALAAGEGEELLGSAFATGAATLQHVRNDPLLPRELVAPDFPGDALRTAYRSFQAAFARTVRDRLRR